jgi:two-component system NtrC family sensor kinase
MARESQPDLILCDLEMPGINGLDVLRTLQSEGFDTPAIMMTAFGSEAIAAQALRIGVKDYIIKPFTSEEILAAVDRALCESRLQAKLVTAKSQLEELKQTLRVVQAVSQVADPGVKPEAALSRIILAAVYGSGAKGGFVASLDSDQTELVIRSTGNLPKWNGRRIPLDQHPAFAEAVRTGELVQHQDRSGQWVCIPLLRRHRAIGVVATVSQRNGIPQHTLQLLTVLASFITFELDRLHQEDSISHLTPKNPENIP